MYAISQIIYGLPLVANDGEPSPRDTAAIAQAIEDEADGFLSYYSGAGDESPAAFGVKLGEFDECCAYLNVADLPLLPTAEQKEQYNRTLEAAAADIKAALSALGAPRVFFLWSTS